MAGVWGRGGLFEQAVQQKYANQGMNAATDRMNADTNRIKAGNDLTLGLRGADIDQMNANTNRFNADTTRADLSARTFGTGPKASTINSFNLGNSFKPDTTSGASQQRPTSYFSGTSSNGTSTFGDSASGLRAFGVSEPEEKKFGFRNSGVVMKPRMVRQPGYKNSGKVMGYARGGGISTEMGRGNYLDMRMAQIDRGLADPNLELVMGPNGKFFFREKQAAASAVSTPAPAQRANPNAPPPAPERNTGGGYVPRVPRNSNVPVINAPEAQIGGGSIPTPVRPRTNAIPGDSSADMTPRSGGFIPTPVSRRGNLVPGSRSGDVTPEGGGITTRALPLSAFDETGSPQRARRVEQSEPIPGAPKNIRPLDMTDIVGGTINQGLRNAGKFFGKDWGYNDAQYLDGRVLGFADSGAAMDPERAKQLAELAALQQEFNADSARNQVDIDSLARRPLASERQAAPASRPAPAAPAAPKGSTFGGLASGSIYRDRTLGFSSGGSAEEGGLRFPKPFGPIGNVEDDTGRDTIDAKVRPGEYLLNPETVENGFGDGDYDKGVRRLDNIVRRATGKEPGPTMMSDDKPGFANSGAQAEFDFGSEERARAEALRREAARSQGFGARAANAGRAAADSVRNAGSAATNSVRGIGAGVNRVLDMSVSEAAKRGSQAGVEAVKAAGRGVGAVLKAGTTGLGRVATPVAAIASAKQTYNTPTEEYYARTGIDPNAEDGNYLDSILPPESSGNPYANAIRDSVGFLGDKQFLKDAGVRSLGALQDLGNTLTFGLADRLGNFDGFERSSYYQDAPAAPAKSAQAGPNTTGVASFMQEVADGGASAGAAQQSAAEKQPSLRDFLENQYRELAADKSFEGSIWRQEQMKNIGDMINNMDQTAAVTGSADAKALAKAQKDNAESVEKTIDNGFTRRYVDEETGEITESLDKEAANEFRRFVLANANELGVPVSMLDPYQVMSLMKDFETRRGVRDMVNRQAGDISSGVVSRELLRPDEVIGTDELSLRDTLPFFGSDSSASFLGDYVPSIFSDGDADQVAVVKRGGKTMRIPLENFTRLPDGSVNEDVLAQFPRLRPPYR